MASDPPQTNQGPKGRPHDEKGRTEFNEPKLATLTARLEKILWHLQRLPLAEFTLLVKEPRRLLWLSFVSGIARGLGTAVGFALLSALLLYILQRLMLLNLPVVGDFIADLVELVQARLSGMPGP